MRRRDLKILCGLFYLTKKKENLVPRFLLQKPKVYREHTEAEREKKRRRERKLDPVEKLLYTVSGGD